MWLVAGLGNPGTKYEHNRHNIGFLAVEALAGKAGAGAWTRKFGGETAEGKWVVDGGRWTVEEKSPSTIHLPLFTKLHFLKPQTFMNFSGESVAAAARFYKVPSENIVVLHDELDLLPGKLRVKKGGGAGGHNGLKSIDAHIGENYWRVRIGIGHPGVAHEVSNYVLSNFLKEEWAIQEKMLHAITDAFGLMLEGDDAGFMNKVALTLAPPRPPKLTKKEP